MVLRRASWLWVQLLLVTLLVFTTVGRSDSDDSQPMFINSAPIFVDSRAWQLVEKIGRDDATKPQATLELMRLGGAALPHILPKLDSLDPRARQELLLALAPLAVRMHLTSTAPSAEESEALWLSFWNDHFVDFHSAMARRVVRRFAQGPTAPRAEEVRRLDTFALGELVRELSRLARERAPSAAAQPVFELMCSIATEPNTPCSRRHVLSDTRAMAESWRGWWLREQHRFEAPNGAERVLSPILQTEYANWVRTSARLVLTGRGLSAFPWRRCVRTAAQFGVALACALAMARLLERRTSHAAVWLRCAIWPCLTIPPLLALFWAGPSSFLAYGGIGAVSGMVSGTWAHLHQRGLPGPFSAVGCVYPQVSHLLGVVLAVEGLSHHDGLGTHLFGALASRDIQTAVWTALGCALLAAAGHMVAGALGMKPLIRKEVSP